MTLLLNKEDIEKVLKMSEAIKVVEKAFLELAQGTAVLPKRIIFEEENNKGDTFFMPCYLKKTGVIGIKISPYRTDNDKRSLPFILGTVSLFSAKTGEVLAIMDAAYLTAIRTGATTAIAVKYLAKKQSQTVGLIGMGAQARTQLEGVCEVRNIKNVKVVTRRPELHDDFIPQMSKKLKVKIRYTNDPKEVCRNSDIVICATPSRKPLIKGEWLEKGCLVVSICSAGPKAREVDTKTVLRSKVVCDYKRACLKEAGDILIPINEARYKKDQIYADLSQLVSHKKKARANESEIFFFKSVGLAIEDIATGFLAYTKARKMGIGKRFKFISPAK